MPADNPIFESAKQRSLRVALDYYQWRDPIVRTKLLISWVVMLLAVLYVGWLFVDAAAGRRHASPGPVAAVHATWDHQCAECHRDFRPLHADSVDFISLIRGSAAAPRAALDEACIKCHAGPIHHANAKTEETATCAACHRDHQGRNASIIRPADSQCTSCHAQIESHRTSPGASPPIANVTGFGPPPSGGTGAHPSFRSLSNDPGQIKFNHWLHMQPGIAVADSRKRLLLSDIDEASRLQYAGFAGAGGTIQLTCAACHQTESASGAPASGDYMQPIAYEQHCRACHPLQVNLATESGPPADVPHGLPSARLAAALDGLLLAAERVNLPAAQATTDESGALPLIPGKTLGHNLAQKIGDDVLRRRAKAAQAIRIKCNQCHYSRESTTAKTNDLPDVAPPNIPATWLTHARFDHRAHRNVECRTCHSAAYAFEQRDKPQLLPHAEARLPAGYTPARDDEQVMIANLESCVTCHAPSRSGSGGARHDCAECHLYHGRDHATAVRSPRGPAVSSPDLKVGVVHQSETVQWSEGPSLGRTFFTSAFQSSTPPAATHADWIGISSCAATGCHGDARADAPAWRSALATWLARDPHAQAYDVLWTFRGREMTRLLSPAEANAVDPPPLTDDQHVQVLEQRCIGCHATPTAHGEAVAPNAYQLGVHCESCHGPASEWIHTHYAKNLSRTAAASFTDTKDLHVRAEACMGCHVGPSNATGQPQVVDHDLIAAGHPRLNFEFHSYLNSLPVHWERARDEQSQAGSFHYRSWLAGQLKQAEQKTKLADYYQKDAKLPSADFAMLDCSACHHQLAASSWRQTATRPNVRLGAPLPAAGPIYLPKPEVWNSTLSNRLRLASTLLSSAASPDRTTWDGSLQAYLAARAIASDVSPQSHASAAAEVNDLKLALDGLGRYLGQDCFVATLKPSTLPSPYDSPTSFSPNAVSQHVQPVIDALAKLATVIATPAAP